MSETVSSDADKGQSETGGVAPATSGAAAPATAEDRCPMCNASLRTKRGTLRTRCPGCGAKITPATEGGAPTATPSSEPEKPAEPAKAEEKPAETKTEPAPAPVAEAPKPVEPGPVAEAPKLAEPAPVGEAPKTEPPKAEAPKGEAPKTEAAKSEAPKTEAPKSEAPKSEAPKSEAPKSEAPKTEAPKTEAPKTEAPKAADSDIKKAKTATGAVKKPAAPAPDGTKPAAPRAAPAAAAGDVGAIKTALVAIDKRVAGTDANIVKIAKAVEALALDGAKRQKAYDELYAEMKDYKLDFIFTAQKPLFMELILLFDSMQRVLKKLEDEKTDLVPRTVVQETITRLKDELLECLYRRDIEPIGLVPPAKLDVEKQKPIKRLETSDPAEDKLVVEVIREGFMRGDSVLRPQEVVVKRHGAAPAAEKPTDKDKGAAVSADADSHERRES